MWLVLPPSEWRRFRAGAAHASGAVNGTNLVAAYHYLLHEHPDPAEIREQAARDWCDWEDAVVQLKEEGWDLEPAVCRSRVPSGVRPHRD